MSSSWVPPPVSTPMSPMVQGAQQAPSWSPPPVSTAPQPLGASNYDWLASVGLGLAGAGVLDTVAGTYYGLKAQQGTYKAEAQNAEFSSNEADIAARAAARDAEEIIRAGQQAAAWRGAREAMDVASIRVGTAASGIEVGSGSAGELERSVRLAAEVDKRAIRTNAERRAAATREAAANTAAGATLGRATAANLRASAGSISPAAGATGAALSGASTLIGNYLAYHGRR